MSAAELDARITEGNAAVRAALSRGDWTEARAWTERLFQWGVAVAKRRHGAGA